MDREIASLKDQLQRCLNELKFYQTKYPSIYQSNSSNNLNDDSLPPWITSSEVMTPLLIAYDASMIYIYLFNV